MADANEFVQALKKAAIDAVEASKPVNVCFGEIISISPLKINVEQKMILEEAQLVLARNVTDFDIMISIDWESEKEAKDHYHSITLKSDNGGDALGADTDIQSSKHTHAVAGKKQITIHNGLDVGDGVILARQQGGQKFLVLDRISR